MNSPHSRPLYIDKALPRAAPHRVAYAMCGVPDWFVAAVLAAVALAAALLATRRCGIPSPMGPWYSDMMMPVLRTGRFPDMVKLHAQHGPLFWWSFLGRRMLMVGTLEAVTRVHLGEGVIVRADYPTSVRKLLGPWGTLNTHGKAHIRIKRLAQPAFTPKAIRGYLPRMQAIAEQAVQKWAAEGDILVHQEMKWFTFRVVVETIVGCDDGWTSPENFPAVSSDFEVWVAGLFSIPLAIPGTAFARGLKKRTALMRRIHASLDLAEAAGQHGPGAGGGRNPASHDDGGAAGAEQPSALDLLMRSRDEEGVGLTRDQIADTVLTLLFAGHDTSSSTLTRIFQHLHRHPEAVQRLRQEQAEVVAKHGSPVTEAALQDMKYAEGVVRETMRITPIINATLRVALQDFELCGYTIKKGTALQCSLTQPIKTDSRWQDEDDVQAFKPERWLHGAAQKQGAWIPFGGGQRLCLGWLLAMTEMKVLLASIFRRYALELRLPEEPWVEFPIARPKHGMPARFVATMDAS